MTTGLINLQDIIEELDVEKRRIYDVFNILEAFKVIFRKEKNVYLWCGIQAIQRTIAEYEHGYSVETTPEVREQCKGKSNKKKMLTSLSARFIKLFLSNERNLSLEEAARFFCS